MLFDLKVAQAAAPPDDPTPGAPEVTTGIARQVTASSAVLTGNLKSNGQRTTFHFQYGPPAGDTLVNAGGTRSTDGEILVTVAGLLPDTSYAYRAVAINSDGTAYGQALVFQTLSASDQETDAPAPDTGPITNPDTDAHSDSDHSSDNTQDNGCFISAATNYKIP